MIRLEIPGQLQQYCGGVNSLTFAVRSVTELFSDLETQCPELYRCVCDETGTVRRHINIFVNTVHVRDRGGIATELVAGDVVFILPAVSGG